LHWQRVFETDWGQESLSSFPHIATSTTSVLTCRVSPVIRYETRTGVSALTGPRHIQHRRNKCRSDNVLFTARPTKMSITEAMQEQIQMATMTTVTRKMLLSLRW